MGKKKIRKGKTSKGQRPSISNMNIEADALTKDLNKLTAWKKGQNPWITVPNPDGGTKERFTKVKANELWGNPKGRGDSAPAGNLVQEVLP